MLHWNHAGCHHITDDGWRNIHIVILELNTTTSSWSLGGLQFVCWFFSLCFPFFYILKTTLSSSPPSLSLSPSSSSSLKWWQAIVYTLRESYKELALLVFLVVISGFIFARSSNLHHSSHFSCNHHHWIHISNHNLHVQPLLLHRDRGGLRLHLHPHRLLLGRHHHDHGVCHDQLHHWYHKQMGGKSKQSYWQWFTT